MSQFSIFATIKKEQKDFFEKKIVIAKGQAKKDTGDARYLKKGSFYGKYFNQQETLALIDLYYNSQFEGPITDSLGDEKLFLNVGKFRSEVASKQIDIDTKNFRFVSDDLTSPFIALFLQKEFREWAKETNFGELVNDCVEAFPKYGTVVLKRVRNVEGMLQKYGLHFVPLQVLRNEMTAESLKTAAYVHEDHVDMKWWEIEAMAGWDISGMEPDYDANFTVIERYGYVPVAFIKAKNKEEILAEDEGKWVNAITVVAMDAENKDDERKNFVLFCAEMSADDRPYEEAHYSRQHGRWMGIGVMEDLFPNQRAKNIVVNVAKRDMQWAARKLFKTKEDMDIVQNLFRDTKDGDLLNVGQNGDLLQVDTVSRNTSSYQQFLNEWDRNADQKAFTYEVATGEQMNSNTPFRLGVLLTNAVNSYFGMKQERLGLFLKRVMQNFMIPQFIADMGKKDRLVSFFSYEQGYEVLKQAAMDLSMWETTKESLLSGVSVDAQTIIDAVKPFDAIQKLVFNLPKDFYNEAKYSFELVITGEEVDIQNKITTLSTILQLLPPGDPRREKILSRLAELGGEYLSTFASDKPNTNALIMAQQTQKPAQVSQNNATAIPTPGAAQ